MPKKGRSKSKKKHGSRIVVEPAPRMTPEMKGRVQQYDESQNMFRNRSLTKSIKGSQKTSPKRSYKS